LLGRDFSPHDDLSAPPVMILNESAARRFFDQRTPIGKIISSDAGHGGKSVVYHVIGVVRDAKYDRVNEDSSLTAYVASAQDINPRPWVNFELRSRWRPVEALMPLVSAAIGQANRNISIEFRNLETQVEDSLLQPRMVALLSAFFGGLALLLAMIGLYGVTAYRVACRHSEIGIRMALGAQPGAVIWLVLREATVMLAIGTALGLAASVAAGRLVASLLFGIKAQDATPLALAALLLAAATGMAALLPAQRAARLDPMTALRQE
jgi:ABC-type antimicrobial peptide transport system permease subunit